MKKIRITGQLVILYVFIVIVAFILFMTITFGQMGNISQSMVQTQLANLVETYKNDWSSGNKVELAISHNIYYVEGKITMSQSQIPDRNRNVTPISYSETIGDKLDLSESSNLSMLVNIVDITPGNVDDINNSIKEISGEKMYCTYGATNVSDGVFYFMLLMEPTSSADSTRAGLTLRVTIAFTAVIAVTLVILIIWSHRHVRRIQELERHISNLPNTNYKEEYLDKGDDELSKLSQSIEDMRVQILKNENTKQEMLQNISHDIKTPIGVIKSYAEAMQDNHCLDTGPSVIIKQSDILYTKTQQLITYNKLSYLTKDKEFEDVNMKRLIESVVSNLKIQKPELEFILNLESVYFKGYSDNYVTVIENIVENAIRYAKTKIEITLKENYIEIYNDGEPIEDKFIKEGFKPYEKGAKGKFGLGMSIVVKTLNFFNYTLSVENKDDGVSFKITPKPKSIN